MLRGAIFDLGSTLISNEYNNRWADLRPRMLSALTADMRAQGLALDEVAFTDAFLRTFNDFDTQRQTHFKEITTEYVLRETFRAIHAAPNGLDFDRALAAFFGPSEALWRPMPGVHETLNELRRQSLKLAIVSNAADDANVQRLIDNHDLRPYFDPIVVSATVGVRKPNPRIFEPVVRAWGLPPAELVMIGDTLGADILGAKHMGFKSIWVTMESDTPYNAAHRHTVLPDATAASLAELPGLIRSLGAR
jgi:HAD superfamily hydrolase (TIGR01662 family)